MRPFSFAAKAIAPDASAAWGDHALNEMQLQFEAEARDAGLVLWDMDRVRQSCGGLDPITDAPCPVCAVLPTTPILRPDGPLYLTQHDWLIVTARATG